MLFYNTQVGKLCNRKLRNWIPDVVVLRTSCDLIVEHLEREMIIGQIRTSERRRSKRVRICVTVSSALITIVDELAVINRSNRSRIVEQLAARGAALGIEKGPGVFRRRKIKSSLPQNWGAGLDVNGYQLWISLTTSIAIMIISGLLLMHNCKPCDLLLTTDDGPLKSIITKYEYGWPCTVCDVIELKRVSSQLDPDSTTSIRWQVWHVVANICVNAFIILPWAIVTEFRVFRPVRKGRPSCGGQAWPISIYQS